MSNRNIFFILAGILACCVSAHAQDSEGLYNAAVEISSGTKTTGSVTSGFSVWGMAGGLVFGSIGFVAFMYGKKNTSAQPMILGIALMAYPYFVRDVLAVYALG